MADAQIAEQELQHSVLMSEGDMEYGGTGLENRHREDLIDQKNDPDVAVPSTSRGADDGPYSLPAETEDATIATHVEAKLEGNEDTLNEEDAEGEEDLPQGDAMVVETHGRYSDAPMSNDDHQSSLPNHSTNADDNEDRNLSSDVVDVVHRGSKDEESDAGTGASERDESDYDDASSQRNTSDESDGEAPWEDAPEGDDEEELEALTPNICVFCKQDEENDPGEEFEEPLACLGCGETCMLATSHGLNYHRLTCDPAHQHCARTAGSIPQSGSKSSGSCHTHSFRGLRHF